MLQTAIKPNVCLGVVNFLNTTPLISGLEFVEGVEFVHEVPSELIGCLERHEVDIALASSIDYQRSEIDLRILPVGVLTAVLTIATIISFILVAYLGSNSMTFNLSSFNWEGVDGITNIFMTVVTLVFFIWHYPSKRNTF